MENYVQKGFTLIELMIVMSLIGTLAAIAIPQYMNYIGRGEAGSALRTVSSLQINTEQLYSDGKVSSEINDVELIGMNENANSLGEISTLVMVNGNATVRFTFTASSTKTNGKYLEMLRDGNAGKWRCESSLAEELLPRPCEAI